MGLITTQVAGFGQPKPSKEQKADPKPVRGFNWLGIPMKEGDYYGGRPEHMAPEEPKREVKEPGVGKGGYTRSEEVRQATRARSYAQHARARAEAARHPSKLPEARAKTSERMKAWWAKRRAEKDLAEMKKANPDLKSG